MAMDDEDPIVRVVRLLARLPGVGEKSARRMAYSLLATGPSYAVALGDAVATLPDRVRQCRVCQTYTGRDECSVCRDPLRTDSVICVVARPWELDAIERAGSFRGRYHVLHALLDPLGGMGPDVFPLQLLLDRVREANTQEVIVATASTVEGEATALYLAESLRSESVRVTRIAAGVPHGGDLEYIDPITLARALDGRRGI
jgi:recombination protein RecR